MNKQGFEQYLQTRKLSPAEIDQHISIVEMFESYLTNEPEPAVLDQANANQARNFVDRLIAEDNNSYENLLALARYGRYSKNNALFVAILELLDGSEAMEGLYRKLGQVAGEQKRDEIFADIALPPLGIPNLEKSRITQLVIQRLERMLDAEECQRVFSDSFRDLPDEYYLADRKQYWEIGNFDQYLETKRQEFIAQLEQIRDQGGLFFSQEINTEVIDFVRSDPEISQGVRQGNILYVTKIPYMTKEYLAETDPEKKRYCACHCPWARESLQRGESPVSARFCQCSAGFHKKPWEVIFGRALVVDVLESVLQGDMRCRFAIHLPAELLEATPQDARTGASPDPEDR